MSESRLDADLSDDADYCWVSLFEIGNSRVEKSEFVMDGKILVSVCGGIITLWEMTPP